MDKVTEIINNLRGILVDPIVDLWEEYKGEVGLVIGTLSLVVGIFQGASLLIVSGLVLVAMTCVDIYDKYV
jgi:hypothetical protein|tara:strand:- start:8847 stop:9059 length:213 start_codon:yes stop_codon:yes gene_type:complete